MLDHDTELLPERNRKNPRDRLKAPVFKNDPAKETRTNFNFFKEWEFDAYY